MVRCSGHGRVKREALDGKGDEIPLPPPAPAHSTPKGVVDL